MEKSTQELFDTVLSLPDGDRVELAEAPITSFRPEDKPPFDDAWRPVIEHHDDVVFTGRHIAGQL